MPVGNPIQFAVVREDPNIELNLIDKLPGGPNGEKQVLLIASAGCTALTLGALRPAVRVRALDANPAQLELYQRKHAALLAHPVDSAERLRLFGVGADDPQSLTACGNFESLFRGLRAVLDDLVSPYAERVRLLRENASWAETTQNRYWPVAFEMFFSDAMLLAMFGPDAVQHAPPGSYARYFRRVLEAGLARSDASHNYFLHHVLLGHYLREAMPEYLKHPAGPQAECIQATATQAPSFADFSLISLSNIFDWMAADDIEKLSHRLCAECQPGSVIAIRQLNNRAPLEGLLERAFRFDASFSERLLKTDRSLFYERLLIGVRSP